MNNKYKVLLSLLLVLNVAYSNESNPLNSKNSKKETTHETHSSHDGDNDHKKHDNLEDESTHKNHDDHKDDDNQKKHSAHEEDNKHKNNDGHEDGERHGKHDDHKDGEKDGEHDDHGEGKSIGKGKAIESVDEVKGFKLSKEAIKTIDLKLQTVDGEEFSIDKKTLVTSKSVKGIYRFRGGYFKFLPIKLIKEINGKYLVNVKGVDFGDQIVTNGVGLLRVTDVYSTDESEYGHSH